jgi:hypothetical protein
MTNDGANTLVYDAENRMLTSTGSAAGAYTYDGNNLRVKKVSGSTTAVYLFSGSKVIAEYVNGAAPSAPTREYIYSGGTLLAKIEAGATKYYHRDHLSNRMVTDSGGNVSAQMGHYPYGESWYNASNDKLLFTSYERDSESGNDCGDIGFTGQVGYMRATSVLELSSASTITSVAGGGHGVAGGIGSDLEGNLLFQVGAGEGIATSATYDVAHVTLVACSQ